MIAPARRSLVLTAVTAAAVLAILFGGALLVRRFLSSALDAYQRTYEIKSLADSAEKLQLEEETDIRGLAATGDSEFLQPYAAARRPLEEVFDRLQAALDDPALAEALPLLTDARETSTAWNFQVARAIVTSPRVSAGRVQRYGKELMGRYRGDFAKIDVILRERNLAVAEQVQNSIDRIDGFVGVFIALLALAGVAYVAQQMRLTARMAAQEHRAAEERRQRGELRAAYEAERRVAETLQKAFTQRPLPLLETLRFSASYVPATEDPKVGGDWYDAMALAGECVLFAIGDVTGHGIDAAVTMSRARQLLISSALLDADPATILTRVNAEIAKDDSRLVTAIAGIANAASYEFSYAIAGHPPPVLVEPGLYPRFLGCGSVPLGAVASPVYETRRVQSVPGATLVLYTDGALEYSHNVLEGEERLLRTIAQAGERAERDLAALIHRGIFGGRPVGDDVAILTIGFAARSKMGANDLGGQGAERVGARIEQWTVLRPGGSRTAENQGSSLRAAFGGIRSAGNESLDAGGPKEGCLPSPLNAERPAWDASHVGQMSVDPPGPPPRMAKPQKPQARRRSSVGRAADS